MATEKTPKRFGLRAQLAGYPWQDVRDEIERDGILISVHDGVMDVEYDSAVDEAQAKQLAQVYLDAHVFRTGTKITADFNHRWEVMDTGETAHLLDITDVAHLTDRVQVTRHQISISGTASIATQDAHDSASFTNDSALVHKALNDETLERALHYFAQEAVDAERARYGIYKAIEVITKHLGKDGRDKIAALAGKGKSYVGDLMQAAQFARHATTTAQVQLSDDECRQRAKSLIQAYADSLT